MATQPTTQTAQGADASATLQDGADRKSTRLNSSHPV